MDRTRLDFDRLAADIAIWNAEVFPKATVQGQILKVHEELEEYVKEHTLEEVADYFIALAGLKYRFRSVFGQKLYEDFMNKIFCEGSANLIYNAVQEKMEINKKRKWTKMDNGVYRHDDELAVTI